MCLSAEAAKMQDKCKFQKRWTNRRQHDVHAALSLILVEDKKEKRGQTCQNSWSVEKSHSFQHLSWSLGSLKPNFVQNLDVTNTVKACILYWFWIERKHFLLNYLYALLEAVLQGLFYKQLCLTLINQGRLTYDFINQGGGGSQPISDFL